jgi:hypothetical protein
MHEQLVLQICKKLIRLIIYILLHKKAIANIKYVALNKLFSQFKFIINLY